MSHNINARKREIRVDEEEFKSLVKLFYKSFNQAEDTKTSDSVDYLKYRMQEYFLRGLEEYLVSGHIKDKQEKIELINTLSRLKLQHEFYEMQLDKFDVKEFKKTVERFGKKMQSSE